MWPLIPAQTFTVQPQFYNIHTHSPPVLSLLLLLSLDVHFLGPQEEEKNSFVNVCMHTMTTMMKRSLLSFTSSLGSGSHNSFLPLNSLLFA